MGDPSSLQQQIIEIGKEPGLCEGAARAIWAVAGQMKATATAMDDGPVARLSCALANTGGLLASLAPEGPRSLP